MGAYKVGEIAEICSCVLPDHAILTGINEQHIERFGSITNTIKAKFELIKDVPTNGIKILNMDNENIVKSYLDYTENAVFYGESSKEN